MISANLPRSHWRDVDDLVGWINEVESTWSLELSAESLLQRDLDSFQLYFLITALEQQLIEPFPSDLLNELETIADLFHFFDTKREHGHPSRSSIE